MVHNIKSKAPRTPGAGWQAHGLRKITTWWVYDNREHGGEMIEYLSFGGGPPSLALGILNAWGEVVPRAEIIVFADTGWEKQATYDLLPVYETWFAEHDMELVTVQSKDGPLQDYVRQRSVPIPVHTKQGLGHRQCTDKWKIRPIEDYLHERFGDVGLIAQLGMCYDEIERLRDPRVKRNRNRWPLVEKRLKRDATVEIVKMAGLPVPPWSSCLGCPLQNDSTWRQVASDHAADFARAVELDEFIRRRGEATGKGPLWLRYSRRPLRDIYSSDQLSLPLVNDGDLGLCESGHCFT